MKVSVTEEDIKFGKKFNLYMCPIALAITRETQHTTIVLPTVVFLGDANRVELPAEAIDFIIRFEAGRNVAPFEFELP